MINRKKTYFNIAFLGFFLILTLFINFFHTEDSFAGSSNSCPACHFQSTTLTTSQIHFFHLPPLTLLEIMSSFQSEACHQITVIQPLSRSPPQA